MTNAEAKKILEAYIACESKKAHFKCDDDNCDDNCPLRYEMGTVGEYNEAINIAIKALEQQPTEITWVAGTDGAKVAFWDVPIPKVLKICKILQEPSISEISMPPIAPQKPKTVLYSGDGYADGYMVYDMAECPNCGYEYEDGDKDWGLSFCPNCGQALNWESEGKE